MNDDCNKTAGLEYVLRVAVGARVMLRRNIDTSAGLVNGAVGTVLSITTEVIKVKFDKISEPYEVEKVNSKFMVMQKFFVCRWQFPLTLAFAITVHKCQGLSLNLALMELSQKAFVSGMAYVALSRVRTLEGVHLISFNKASIIVSRDCLQEVNRLRKEYRPDLPAYSIPKNAKSLKLTGCLTLHDPDVKLPSRKKGFNQKRGLKRPLAGNDNTKPAKKMRTKKRSMKSKPTDDDDDYVPSKKVCVAPKNDVRVTWVDPPGTFQRNYMYSAGHS